MSPTIYFATSGIVCISSLSSSKNTKLADVDNEVGTSRRSRGGDHARRVAASHWAMPTRWHGCGGQEDMEHPLDLHDVFLVLDLPVDVLLELEEQFLRLWCQTAALINICVKEMTLL